MRFITLSFFFLLFSTVLLAQEQYYTMTFVYKGPKSNLNKRQLKVTKAMDETKIERVIAFEYRKDAAHLKVNRVREFKKVTSVSFDKVSFIIERPLLKKTKNRRVMIVYKATPDEWKNILKGISNKPLSRNDYEGFNCGDK